MIHNHRQEIRFSDIDALGHVNNAVFLNYFEEARVSFFNKLNDGPWDWANQGILLARNEIDYHKPVYLGDAAEIDVWVEKVGTKSFILVYQLYRYQSGQRILCTSGKSVLVAFDFKKGVSIEIPEMWKSKLTSRIVTQH